MRNLEATDVIDTPNGTSRRSLFRKALAAAAAVAGTGVLLDFSKRTARAANGDPLTVGNTDPALPGGPDTSSNATQLDKDNLNAEPTLVLTNQNGDGLVSTGTNVGTRAEGATVGSFGRSGNRGVEGQGGVVGVLGVGTAGNSAGVSGLAESGPNSTGVFGRASAVGVYGQGPIGVLGQSVDQGVRGEGPKGVVGVGTGAASLGVDAQGGAFGVRGVSTAANGFGVSGLSTADFTTGVRGVCSGAQGIGVSGRGQDQGVRGEGIFGVVGATTVAGRTGVLCQGNFVATGSKSAAVAHPDGSHRLLYCMESPESWFEDFGSAALAGGRASVKLDADFAAVVNTADYRVFLTPEGDSRGLYVSSKSATGFTVHEQQGGTSRLPFSYRVVARRKDVEAVRLARFSLPATPTPTDAGSADSPDIPPLEPSQVSALPPARSRPR